MSTDEHRTERELLGAYALGHLSAADDASVAAHLDGCAACSAELAELRPVVRQLELLGPVTALEPPPDLGDRIMRTLAAERAADRGRPADPPGGAGGWRSRTAALVAASAVAAATVSALVVQAAQPDGPPLEPVAVRVETGGVVADADLVAHTWGTEIKLTATGLDQGEIYRVAVVTGDGRESPAGEFVGTGAAPLHCNLNSGVLRPEAVGFVVVDDAGREVLASTFVA